MLKETVTYIDYNGDTQTEDLYFHISKAELLDHIDLSETLTTLQNRISSSEAPELSVANLREIISLVKLFVKLGYGVRSEDGKRFRKNEQVWEEFESSAAYDQLVYSMFETPDKAVSFLTNIMPADLITSAKEQLEERTKVTEIVPGASTAEDISELESRLEELRKAQG